ncbi:MAG: hypothetical protein HGA85_00270 [Nanoarchaeota archaeon]|nr:hypothetical protein [Nanoarchaeota archaeon]
MTELIACLSTGKGTWTDVVKLAASAEWDKIILITDDFGAQTFHKKDNMELIVINANESVELLIDKIYTNLKAKVEGSEVALNFLSGSGKEHMALLSAVLKLGVGVRLVIPHVSGVKTI